MIFNKNSQLILLLVNHLLRFTVSLFTDWSLTKIAYDLITYKSFSEILNWSYHPQIFFIDLLLIINFVIHKSLTSVWDCSIVFDFVTCISYLTAYNYILFNAFVKENKSCKIEPNNLAGLYEDLVITMLFDLIRRPCHLI